MRNFKWNETADSVTLLLPIKHTPMKHIDILITEVYVKVNIPSKKYFIYFDMLHEIDYASPQNRTQVQSEVLQIYLRKQNPELWGELEYRDSKANLQARRNTAIENYNKWREEQDELKDKVKMSNIYIYIYIY